MSGLCNQISGLAHWFLLLALFLAVVETLASIWVRLYPPNKPKDDDKRTVAGPDVGPILEGLAKVLSALKELPAWVAIFLAGLALVWTAASAPQICP